MDQVFSIGHQVWAFLQSLVNPEQYSEWIQQGWPIAVGVIILIAFVYLLKGRRRNVERRQQLEALEEALLDDDIEEKSLELPDLPNETSLYEEYPDGEDFSEKAEDDPVPEPLARTLARDPEFGGQIVIAANSSRRPPTEPGPDTPQPDNSSLDQDDSTADIEEEFAQFAEELKEKAKEVQRRHQIEAEMMENELFEEDLEEQVSTGPIVLSAVDMLPEEDESDSSWNQELDDLLEEPQISRVSDGDLFEREPLEVKERNERLIETLEEFQRDFEHKLQSRTLSQLAQKNFELVESLSDSEQTREYQAMKRTQLDSLSALESIVFGTEKKKR
ncbi:MAG: hypothetical protein G3M70_14645 [Candidatus Nitronauta litoralis]|uniref:Uncharacterized protein n=1 Tax=Candidatus Nitronauta litoralis TaxID=2705533 RepID=A0A7T0G1N2_9BACT|nr:MAG: hypothetical protein G3M70_14645 [Candidatus Nitronauta litoralis]